MAQDVWTFQIGVRDLGNPAFTDTTTVSITIQRIGLPFFSDAQYDVTIQEAKPVNENVITLQVQNPGAGVCIILFL